MDVDPNWIEGFISAVEIRPILYNKMDNGYVDKDLKTQAWTEVCETIVPGWKDMADQDRKTKGKELQQRWTNLRHCFLRELRQQNKSAMSGQAAKKRRRYIYFEQLLFLLPTVEDKKLVSSFQYDEDEMAGLVTETNYGSPRDNVNNIMAREPPHASSTSTSAATCRDTTASRQTSKRKRSSSDNKSFDRKLLNILSERTTTESADEIDEDKLFLLSFVPAMRRLSAETRFEAKMEFMKTMHRFELRDRQHHQVLLETLSRQHSVLPPRTCATTPPPHHSQQQQRSRNASATSSNSDSQSYQNDDANYIF